MRTKPNAIDRVCVQVCVIGIVPIDPNSAKYHDEEQWEINPVHPANRERMLALQPKRYTWRAGRDLFWISEFQLCPRYTKRLAAGRVIEPITACVDTLRQPLAESYRERNSPQHIEFCGQRHQMPDFRREWGDELCQDVCPEEKRSTLHPVRHYRYSPADRLSCRQVHHD